MLFFAAVAARFNILHGGHVRAPERRLYRQVLLVWYVLQLLRCAMDTDWRGKNKCFRHQ